MLDNVGRLMFGANPDRRSVALITAAALIGGVALCAAYAADGALTVGVALVVFVLAADLIGGCVANVSASTNATYAAKPMRARIVFLLVHAFHPALAVLALGAPVVPFAALYGYMLASGLIVLSVREASMQRQIAAALLAVGIVGWLMLDVPRLLLWFGPVYLFKLVYAFSVEHGKGGEGAAL